MITFSGVPLPTPQAHAEVVVSSPSQILGSLQIPEEFGTIQEQFAPETLSPNDRLVFYVQSAHGNSDSENNTHNLIKFLQEKYNLPLVLLEGGEGKLESLYFKSFPNGDAKDIVLADYVSKGDLSGGEIASIADTAGFTEYYGIETEALYIKNKNAFLQALAVEDQILKMVDDARSSLWQKSSKLLSTESKQFAEDTRSFERGDLNLVLYLKALKPLHGNDSAFNANYPELAKLIQVEANEKILSAETLDGITTQFIKAFESAIKPRLLKEDQIAINGSIQKFRTGVLDRGALLNEIEAATKKANGHVRIPQELQGSLRQAQTISSIKGTRLFDELALLQDDIRTILAESDAEGAVLNDLRNLSILHDFAKLELLPKYWREFKGKKPSQLLSSASIKNMDAMFEPHFTFYELAEKRDEALFANTINLMDENKTKVAFVTTGGFHARGITSRLKESGNAYVLISPAIAEMTDREIYLNAMREKRSFMKYYKGSLWDALAQDYAAKLAATLDERELTPQLKRWRDRIIQNSIAEGRITQAGQYTKYVDALVQALRSEFEKGSGIGALSDVQLRKQIGEELDKFFDSYMEKLERTLNRKIDNLSSGLKTLWERKDFSPEAVGALLTKANAPAQSNIAASIVMIRTGAASGISEGAVREAAKAMEFSDEEIDAKVDRLLDMGVRPEVLSGVALSSEAFLKVLGDDAANALKVIGTADPQQIRQIQEALARAEVRAGQRQRAQNIARNIVALQADDKIDIEQVGESAESKSGARWDERPVLNPDNVISMKIIDEQNGEVKIHLIQKNNEGEQTLEITFPIILKSEILERFGAHAEVRSTLEDWEAAKEVLTNLKAERKNSITVDDIEEIVDQEFDRDVFMGLADGRIADEKARILETIRTELQEGGVSADVIELIDIVPTKWVTYIGEVEFEVVVRPIPGNTETITHEIKALGDELDAIVRGKDLSDKVARADAFVGTSQYQMDQEKINKLAAKVEYLFGDQLSESLFGRIIANRFSSENTSAELDGRIAAIRQELASIASNVDIGESDLPDESARFLTGSLNRLQVTVGDYVIEAVFGSDGGFNGESQLGSVKYRHNDWASSDGYALMNWTLTDETQGRARLKEALDALKSELEKKIDSGAEIGFGSFDYVLKPILTRAEVRSQEDKIAELESFFRVFVGTLGRYGLPTEVGENNGFVAEGITQSDLAYPDKRNIGLSVVGDPSTGEPMIGMAAYDLGETNPVFVLHSEDNLIEVKKGDKSTVYARYGIFLKNGKWHYGAFKEPLPLHALVHFDLSVTEKRRLKSRGVNFLNDPSLPIQLASKSDQIQFFRDHGLPSAPFMVVDENTSENEAEELLRSFVAEHGQDIVIKADMGFKGQGVYIRHASPENLISNADQISGITKTGKVVVEKRTHSFFDSETISDIEVRVLAVRGKGGEVHFNPGDLRSVKVIARGQTGGSRNRFTDGSDIANRIGEERYQKMLDISADFMEASSEISDSQGIVAIDFTVVRDGTSEGQILIREVNMLRSGGLGQLGSTLESETWKDSAPLAELLSERASSHTVVSPEDADVVDDIDPRDSLGLLDALNFAAGSMGLGKRRSYELMSMAIERIESAEPVPVADRQFAGATVYHTRGLTALSIFQEVQGSNPEEARQFLATALSDLEKATELGVPGLDLTIQAIRNALRAEVRVATEADVKRIQQEHRDDIVRIEKLETPERLAQALEIVDSFDEAELFAIANMIMRYEGINGRVEGGYFSFIQPILRLDGKKFEDLESLLSFKFGGGEHEGAIRDRIISRVADYLNIIHGTSRNGSDYTITWSLEEEMVETRQRTNRIGFRPEKFGSQEELPNKLDSLIDTAKDLDELGISPLLLSAREHIEKNEWSEAWQKLGQARDRVPGANYKIANRIGEVQRHVDYISKLHGKQVSKEDRQSIVDEALNIMERYGYIGPQSYPDQHDPVNKGELEDNVLKEYSGNGHYLDIVTRAHIQAVFRYVKHTGFGSFSFMTETDQQNDGDWDSIRRMFQSPEFLDRVAWDLNRAYNANEGTNYGLYDIESATDVVESLTERQRRIGEKLPAFYSVEAGAQAIADLTQETPAQVLMRISEGKLTADERSVLMSMMEGATKVAYLFQGLFNAREQAFTPFAIQAPMVTVQYQKELEVAAAFVLDRLKEEDSVSNQRKHLKSLLQDAEFSELMARQIHQKAPREGDEVGALYDQAKADEVTGLTQIESAIATSAAAFVALDGAVLALQKSFPEREQQEIRDIMADIATHSEENPRLSHEELNLIMRYANLTWKASQPFRGFENRILKDNFIPWDDLPESEKYKDLVMLRASAQTVLDELDRANQGVEERSTELEALTGRLEGLPEGLLKDDVNQARRRNAVALVRGSIANPEIASIVTDYLLSDERTDMQAMILGGTHAPKVLATLEEVSQQHTDSLAESFAQNLGDREAADSFRIRREAMSRTQEDVDELADLGKKYNLAFWEEGEREAFENQEEYWRAESEMAAARKAKDARWAAHDAEDEAQEADMQGIIDEAGEMMSKAETFMGRAVEVAQAEDAVLDSSSRTKGLSSAARKVGNFRKTDWGADAGMSDLFDLLGGRIVVEDARTLAAIMEVIDGAPETEDGKVEILRKENKFIANDGQDNPYRAVQYTITVPGEDLQTVELQLKTFNSSIADDLYHNAVYKSYILQLPGNLVETVKRYVWQTTYREMLAYLEAEAKTNDALRKDLDALLREQKEVRKVEVDNLPLSEQINRAIEDHDYNAFFDLVLNKIGAHTFKNKEEWIKAYDYINAFLDKEVELIRGLPREVQLRLAAVAHDKGYWETDPVKAQVDDPNNEQLGWELQGKAASLLSKAGRENYDNRFETFTTKGNKLSVTDLDLQNMNEEKLRKFFKEAKGGTVPAADSKLENLIQDILWVRSLTETDTEDEATAKKMKKVLGLKIMNLYHTTFNNLLAVGEDTSHPFFIKDESERNTWNHKIVDNQIKAAAAAVILTEIGGEYQDENGRTVQRDLSRVAAVAEDGTQYTGREKYTHLIWKFGINWPGERAFDGLDRNGENFDEWSVDKRAVLTHEEFINSDEQDYVEQRMIDETVDRVALAAITEIQLEALRDQVTTLTASDHDTKVELARLQRARLEILSKYLMSILPNNGFSTEVVSYISGVFNKQIWDLMRGNDESDSTQASIVERASGPVVSSYSVGGSELDQRVNNAVAFAGFDAYELFQLAGIFEENRKRIVSNLKPAEVLPVVGEIRSRLNTQGVAVVLGSSGSGKSEQVEMATGDSSVRKFKLWDAFFESPAQAARGQSWDDFSAEYKSSYGIKADENAWFRGEQARILSELSEAEEDVIVLDEFDLAIGETLQGAELETFNLVIDLAARLHKDHGKQVVIVLHSKGTNTPGVLGNEDGSEGKLIESGLLGSKEELIRTRYFTDSQQMNLLQAAGLNENEARGFIEKAEGVPAAYLTIIDDLAKVAAGVHGADDFKPTGAELESEAEVAIRKSYRVAQQTMNPRIGTLLADVAFGKRSSDDVEVQEFSGLLLDTGLVNSDLSMPTMVSRMIRRLDNFDRSFAKLDRSALPEAYRNFADGPSYNADWHVEGGTHAQLRDHLGLIFENLTNVDDDSVFDSVPEEAVVELRARALKDIRFLVLFIHAHDIGKATKHEAKANPAHGYGFWGHEQVSYEVLSQHSLIYDGLDVSKSPLLKFAIKQHGYLFRMDESDDLDGLKADFDQEMGRPTSEQEFDDALGLLIAGNTLDLLGTRFAVDGQPGEAYAKFEPLRTLIAARNARRVAVRSRAEVQAVDTDGLADQLTSQRARDEIKRLSHFELVSYTYNVSQRLVSKHAETLQATAYKFSATIITETGGSIDVTPTDSGSFPESVDRALSSLSDRNFSIIELRNGAQNSRILYVDSELEGRMARGEETRFGISISQRDNEEEARALAKEKVEEQLEKFPWLAENPFYSAEAIEEAFYERIINRAEVRSAEEAKWPEGYERGPISTTGEIREATLQATRPADVSPKDFDTAAARVLENPPRSERNRGGRAEVRALFPGEIHNGLDRVVSDKTKQWNRLSEAEKYQSMADLISNLNANWADLESTLMGLAEMIEEKKHKEASFYILTPEERALFKVIIDRFFYSEIMDPLAKRFRSEPYRLAQVGLPVTGHTHQHLFLLA